MRPTATPVPDPGRRLQAAIVLAFPAMLAAGIFLIPVVTDYSEHGLAADAVRDSTLRWAWGHVIAAAAFGLGALAPFVIAGVLSAPRRRTIARTAAACMALGAALHSAGLGADGIGPVALLWSGGDPQAFFDGSSTLIPPLFIAGAVLFGTGQIVLILQARGDGMVSRRSASILLGFAILFSIAEALPTGWGLYAVAVCAAAIYGTFARRLPEA